MPRRMLEMKAWVNIHKLEIAYLFEIWIPKCLLGNRISSWIYVRLLLVNLKPQWIYAKTSVDKQPQKYGKKHISSLFARKYRDSQWKKHTKSQSIIVSVFDGNLGKNFTFFFINEIPSTKFKFFFTSPEWCWLVPTFHLCYEKWMFRLRVIKLVLMVFFYNTWIYCCYGCLLLALVLPVRHQFIAILNEHLKSFWFRFLFFPPHIYCWFFIFVLLIH